jgi:hypothetical protein
VTIGVKARLVGVDALATFFLAVVWNLAEDTNLFVTVGVVAGLLLVRIPPRIGIAPVAACPSVVAPEVPVLTPG